MLKNPRRGWRLWRVHRDSRSIGTESDKEKTICWPSSWTYWPGVASDCRRRCLAETFLTKQTWRRSLSGNESKNGAGPKLILPCWWSRHVLKKMMIRQSLHNFIGQILFYLDFNDPSYVCSPQSTIIASVIIVIVLNIGLIAAFVVFYRLKRKQWSKRSASVSPASSSHLLTITGAPNTSRVYPSVAPPVPTRPKTASGSLGGGNFLTGPPPIHNSGSSPNVIYKRPGEVSSAGSNGSRQRFSGLSASSLASLPRDWVPSTIEKCIMPPPLNPSKIPCYKSLLTKCIINFIFDVEGFNFIENVYLETENGCSGNLLKAKLGLLPFLCFLSCHLKTIPITYVFFCFLKSPSIPWSHTDSNFYYHT